MISVGSSRITDTLLREAPIPSGSFKGPLSVCLCVCVSEILVIFAKGTSELYGVISASTIFRKSVHGFFGNPHKVSFSNDAGIPRDPFLDPFLSKKVKILQKSTPIYCCRK